MSMAFLNENGGAFTLEPTPPAAGGTELRQHLTLGLVMTLKVSHVQEDLHLWQRADETGNNLNITQINFPYILAGH